MSPTQLIATTERHDSMQSFRTCDVYHRISKMCRWPILALGFPSQNKRALSGYANRLSCPFDYPGVNEPLQVIQCAPPVSVFRFVCERASDRTVKNLSHWYFVCRRESEREGSSQDPFAPLLPSTRRPLLPTPAHLVPVPQKPAKIPMFIVDWNNWQHVRSRNKVHYDCKIVSHDF